MKDRIELLIKAKNLTAAQFADEIGVTKSSISHIISGRNNASLDFVQKILLRYPEVDMEWLMFGKGQLFKDEENDADTPPDEALKPVSSPARSSVDLFSGMTPERATDFRRENDLIQQEHQTKNSKTEALKIDVADKENTEEEEQANLPSMKVETENFKKAQNNTSTKSIAKIVEFYSDNTFREYFPES